MPYLVDTHWVIQHLAAVPEAHTLLDHLAPEGIAISVVTYMEVFEGLARELDPDAAQARFRSLIDTLPVLPFSIAVAERCAYLRGSLRAQGRRVNQRALDLLIAATALEHDLTLVTRNATDYRDIPGLQLYREAGEP